MAPQAYGFRPMTENDLPLIRRWLAAPHVAQWWGRPDEQFGIVSGDLEEPAVDQFIVANGDRPFAYLQCYDPSAWPDTGFGPLLAGTRGIDQFIGEADMIEHGHGSGFVRMFVDGLLSRGTPLVITDPEPGNARAIRAYEKAGFRKERLVDTPNGPALLMLRDA
jgi:aminoglycoside 6'-N-acetyltransferase